jgi:hypothetical protein
VKASEILPEAPDRLTAPALALDDDHVAVHDPDAEPVVVPVESARSQAPQRIGPVYRRVPGGDPVVPTGRVLVRFEPGLPDDRGAALAAAGYELLEAIDYAPGAVWAQAPDGDVAGALAGLGRLTASPAVASAEPELIAERTWR